MHVFMQLTLLAYPVTLYMNYIRHIFERPYSKYIHRVALDGYSSNIHQQMEGMHDRLIVCIYICMYVCMGLSIHLS
jgi:hypothetical protein